MADNNPKSGTSSSFLFILSFIIVVIATFTTIGVLQPFRDYVEHLIPFTARETIFHGRLFTKKELSQFTGADDGDVYLAILGDVFDVTKGRKHYGVGGGYGFFSGDFSYIPDSFHRYSITGADNLFSCILMILDLIRQVSPQNRFFFWWIWLRCIDKKTSCKC